MAGSVSGGCVEAAVYELATEVVRTGQPQLQRYGITDDDAFAVGLTCGGIIDIFAEPVSQTTFPQLGAVADDIAAHRPTAVATVIAHPDPERIGRRLVVGETSVEGSLGSARSDDAVADDARGLLAAGRTAVLTYGPDGQRQGTGMEVFVASHAPRPRMIVFGAIDFAAALTRQAAFLGYRVTVCDARRGLRHAPPGSRPPTRSSSTGPHRYLSAQHAAGRHRLPDRASAYSPTTRSSTSRCSKWRCGCRSIGYIGAMGSRATHDDRLDRLRELGLTEAELSRLASPIGLDLGARTPEETAVSIAAEIIARRWGGGGRPLADVDGRIHHDVAEHAGDYHR